MKPTDSIDWEDDSVTLFFVAMNSAFALFAVPTQVAVIVYKIIGGEEVNAFVLFFLGVWYAVLALQLVAILVSYIIYTRVLYSAKCLECNERGKWEGDISHGKNCNTGWDYEDRQKIYKEL